MSIKLKYALRQFRTSLNLRKAFYEDFSAALKGDEAPVTRLDKMIGRERRRMNHLGAIRYSHWLKRLSRTNYLSTALQGSIPQPEVLILHAAEKDGRLHEAMSYLAATLDIQRKIKNSYIISLASPVISGIIFLGILYIYHVYIGPTNLSIIPLDKWPFAPRVMYEISSFLFNYTYFVAILFFVLVRVVAWSKPNWVGSWRKRVDSIVLLPWSNYREKQSNSFLMSLGLILQSESMGLKEALEEMREYSSPWMKWHIGNMQRRLILHPNQEARSLETGLFPTKTMHRIEDFCDRSDFQVAMKTLALEQGDYQIGRANIYAVIISVICLLLCAALILFFAFAQIEFASAIEGNIKF